ncbi:MAG: hypothetical protein JSW50_07820 [Candidatus Latescibacterota bacterium]|nr:MAG: hypothetical protein JSW50_07820 [Candidatus Latescibacterota bacterium]
MQRMDDTNFIKQINEIARQNQLKLPTVGKGDLPPTEFLDDWALFLETCVRSGIQLSDDRWQRVAVLSRTPHTVFVLEDSDGEARDPDFRVGLQLLMGLLEEQEENQD